MTKLDSESSLRRFDSCPCNSTYGVLVCTSCCEHERSDSISDRWPLLKEYKMVKILVAIIIALSAVEAIAGPKINIRIGDRPRYYQPYPYYYQPPGYYPPPGYYYPQPYPYGYYPPYYRERDRGSINFNFRGK